MNTIIVTAKKNYGAGFTLIELLVVVAVIGILTSVLTVNFNNARESARDDARKADLKQLQLAIELYKAQNGFYPAEGCAGAGGPGDTPASGTDWEGSATWTGAGEHTAAWGTECDEYIVGLVPEFIDRLPIDPTNEWDDNRGFLYRVSADGLVYKLLLNNVESEQVEGYESEFARCPADCGNTHCDADGPQPNTYAVYSAGAECQ